MNIVHVAAHLGGGVGKAHAALRAAMPESIRQTYLLLEPPRDRRYADEISAHGGTLRIASSLDDVADAAREADIVQIEFWNHPKLFECLARTAFPVMRSVFWSHVSGLFRPVIPPGFLSSADRFVFTTPASMVLGADLPASLRANLSAIGSGFGFADPPATATATGPAIAYLGTVDFVKMHPGFFDTIDALTTGVSAVVWGGYDPHGEVAARVRAMRHPDRIRLMGQTDDPAAALGASRIFFYPLRPDHYGTAENALIEAMSLGLVPVVLANPAELAIVEDGVTGFVAASIGDCAACLDRLLASPELVARLGANARRFASQTHRPDRSASAFISLWRGMLDDIRRDHDFASITGRSPLDWYRATQGADAPAPASDREAKGTLAHFRSAFPSDPCWQNG